MFRSLPAAVLALSFVTLAMPVTVSAQNRQPGRSLCANGTVSTGTNFGNIPPQKMSGFEVPPDLIQGAALHASVADANQTTVERAFIQSMSNQGKWGRVEDRLWPQVRDAMMNSRPQADAVAQQKREMAGRVIAGTMAGVGAMALNGSVQSGYYAAQNYGGRGAEMMQSAPLRMPSGGSPIASGPLLEQAVEQMVSSPCQVSAGQVLQQLRRP